MHDPTTSPSGTPFSTEARRRRYDSQRYRGAVGRNWYDCDPTLQFLMAQYLQPAQLAWAEPRLRELGGLMGGPIAARAEETDRNPPQLRRYDRWGHDVSEVVLPPSFLANRADLHRLNFTSPAFAAEAAQAGVDPEPLAAAWTYLLNQAEIGMTCALGTGGDMVLRMAEAYAPPEVRARVAELFPHGGFSGEAAQMFTERTGGSDLGELETTATPDGQGGWRLDGVKWFVSNVQAGAMIALAKVAGGPDGTRGVAPFLVLRQRLDGTPNGIRIRRLKDKLGTRAVPSGEVELVGAEAFLLGPVPGAEAGDAGAEGSARRPSGLAQMMRLTNGARLAIAMMGVGCARRALVEALCYTSAREAFGAALVDQPLVQRKLAELVVAVEAAQALTFSGLLGPKLRLLAPLAKLEAARLGVTAASDALELHGGNGYIEDWPLARILRDAQVNPVWEGPDNILCLDVRRAIEREDADRPLLAWVTETLEAAPVDPALRPARDLLAQGLARAEAALATWRRLEGPVAEARLFPLATLLARTAATAALVAQATLELQGRAGSGTRKALVAQLYARRMLQPADPLAELEQEPLELLHFKELRDGAFLDISEEAQAGR
ncbi:acyl-CoA dehydrogenase family protein [Aciditerrimonas ferrireducens]|uniref:acyl-CoA dehydrogenase family protein n=1 Tax=Aciditerrimonas ferrireducens TaxID=667306 RepID=UPI0020050030|nr:acyl-CoA dehydrogenase family protein [Aciditerrimonas ferrireducens]MCK4176064.1 acyl-CoA dehydrogenase family protein [Aciditerrimonas ferrireducens]